MSMKFRNVLAVAFAAAALVASAGASAGAMDKAAEKLRNQNSGQKSEEKPITRPAPPATVPKPRSEPRSDSPRGNFGAPAPAPRNNGNGRDSRGPDRGGDRAGPVRGDDRDTNRGSNGNLRDDLARLQGKDPGNDRNRGGTWGPGRGDSRGGHHSPRPPRVVERLPSGHRDYYWNGARYYTYGGHWYRPYGTSFISVGIPFGLFVTTLPGIYSSFWIDGTRYFYADHTYYVYEPVRRGYVVTRSPYGDDLDDEEYDDTGSGDDLYIYPARGQSEQQQADDRYQCHRWAAQESHYDPLDDDYDAELRKDYRRAMTACLTGRGYSVN